MLDQLKIYFIEENNQNIQNYKSYSDLSGLTIEQLWTHANEYGYKEQRQIFNDCYYNRLFYDYYLADYRKIVLSNHPNFDWRTYNIKSEYGALIDYISKCNLSYNETSDISYTNPHYSLIAECPNYDYQTFPFAYGSAQWSSPWFGIIVPCKSILKRGYFMYLYDNESDYESSDLLDEYDFNEEKIRIRLDLYINGTQSDYYIEETLDPSKNMLGALFKKKNINGPTISVDYDEIVLEENSVISWFCSELLGKNIDGNYTNYPFNPSRNRFIMIMEPYNTRFVSNTGLLDEFKNDIDVIKSEIDLNEHNISLKQNKLTVGNNIKIVDNVISVVGVSGVESNLFFVNELRNEIELSLNELNDSIIFQENIVQDLSDNIIDLQTNKQNNITSSTDLSMNHVDVSGLNVSGTTILNDLSINGTLYYSGLNLESNAINPDSDISVNSLYVRTHTKIQDRLAISMDICDNYVLSVSGDVFLKGRLIDEFGDEYIGTSGSSGIFTSDDNLNYTTNKNVNIGTSDICDNYRLNVDGGVRLYNGSFGSSYEVSNYNDWIPDLSNNIYYTNGNVGIGVYNNDSPYILDIHGGVRIKNNYDSLNTIDISGGWASAQDYIYYPNKVVIGGTTDVGDDSKLYVNGSITADILNLTSDKRLKEHIEDICGSLTILRQLHPKKYTKGSNIEIGFIANDILEINDISFVVSTTNTYYSLNYNSLFSLSIQSIKELDNEVNELKTKNEELEQRLEALEHFIHKNM